MGLQTKKILTLCGSALPVGTNWVSSGEMRDGVRFHGSSDAGPQASALIARHVTSANMAPPRMFHCSRG